MNLAQHLGRFDNGLGAQLVDEAVVSGYRGARAARVGVEQVAAVSQVAVGAVWNAVILLHTVIFLQPVAEGLLHRRAQVADVQRVGAAEEPLVRVVSGGEIADHAPGVGLGFDVLG